MSRVTCSLMKSFCLFSALLPQSYERTYYPPYCCNILRKCQYFGHIIRGDGVQRLLMEGRINGRRGRGRPRTMWTDNIKEYYPPYCCCRCRLRVAVSPVPEVAAGPCSIPPSDVIDQSKCPWPLKIGEQPLGSGVTISSFF